MRSLYVKNFGPITEAKIEVRKFNFFIGEQSIGKSTLAKLVTIFTDYLNLSALLLEKDSVWKKVLTQYDLQTCITVGKDYIVVYEEHVKDISIRIQIENGIVDGRVLLDQQEVTDDKKILKYVLGCKKLYHQQRFEEVQNIEDEVELKKSFIQLLQNSLYIPAERSIASIVRSIAPVMMMVKEQIPTNLLRFTSELGNAKSSFVNQRIGVLNLTYKKENEEDVAVFDDGQLIPLKYTSSGIQSALPLVLSVLYGIQNKEYDSFVVEEPECNLFPQKQVELLRFLIENVCDKDRMLTITTHSPYLLSALNNYLYASSLYAQWPEELSELVQVVPSTFWLRAEDCAIYSLGEQINRGVYCKSLVDLETGLIDFNYHDGVSIMMGEEFSKLQDIQIAHQRKQRSKKA